MPKDRKKTYGDHQSQAARAKKQQPKPKPQSASTPAAPPAAREATKK